MGKKVFVQNKTLGGLLFVGLIIQYVFPAIKLGSFSWIATLIYLLVAIYLMFL